MVFLEHHKDDRYSKPLRSLIEVVLYLLFLKHIWLPLFSFKYPAELVLNTDVWNAKIKKVTVGSLMLRIK